MQLELEEIYKTLQLPSTQDYFAFHMQHLNLALKLVFG